MTDKIPEIKNTDMSDEMSQDALDFAAVAMKKFKLEKDIAGYLKENFDLKYNPTWHAIVGRNFGSNVTHELNHFIYFYLDELAFLLFKSG